MAGHRDPALQVSRQSVHEKHAGGPQGHEAGRTEVFERFTTLAKRAIVAVRGGSGVVWGTASTAPGERCPGWPDRGHGRGSTPPSTVSSCPGRARRTASAAGRGRGPGDGRPVGQGRAVPDRHRRRRDPAPLRRDPRPGRFPLSPPRLQPAGQGRTGDLPCGRPVPSGTSASIPKTCCSACSPSARAPPPGSCRPSPAWMPAPCASRSWTGLPSKPRRPARWAPGSYRPATVTWAGCSTVKR